MMEVGIAWTDSDLCYRPCNITESDREKIFRIWFGFGIVSLIAVLAIIGHAVVKRLFFTSEVRPLMHLSIANTGFCICLILLTCFYMFSSKNNIERTTFYLITLEEFFYLISFNLTANYTIVDYVRLRNKLRMSEELQLETHSTMKRTLRLTYVLSWVLPPLLLIPVTVAVLAEPVKIQLCLLCPSVIYYPISEDTIFENGFLKNYGIILVIAAFVVVAIVMSIFFSLSWGICSKLSKRQNTAIDVYEQTTIRWIRRRMSLNVFGFFYCWTPTFILAILVLAVDLVNLEISNCAPLFYVWAVTAPCHGLILAIIYFASIYYQNTQSQFRRTRRPFGSRIYRFYGTGSQRTKWPRVRTPSSSVSEGNQVGDTNSNVGGASSPSSTASPSGNKKVQRRPSFLGLLKAQDNELSKGDGVDNSVTF
ncbi:uncharacterized protein LOC100890241 isoform X2 [Strongylocentrotus purpuratus]|uniref:Uncharacterized protein n=1 Tax=Strongylocentrotus purpuratus TaxID=7668 RepID=A0A7M7P7W4_STRPU|nr:uncharacterized protein LOC100890241 isoform X2 [Strongylocentrotus purpuratus]